MKRLNGDFKQVDSRHVYLRKGANDLVVKLDTRNNKPRLNFVLKPGEEKKR